MAVAKLLRIEVFVHSSARLKLLSALQKAELLHLDSLDETGLGLSFSQPDISKLDHQMIRLSQAVGFLGEWEGRKTAKNLFAGKPQLSRETGLDELDFDIDAVLDKVEEYQSNRTGLKSHIDFLRKEKSLLLPMQILDIPVLSVASTDSVDLRLGHLPFSRLAELERFCSDLPVDFDLIDRGKRDAYALIYAHNGLVQEVDSALKEMGFVSFFFPESLLNKTSSGDRVSDLIIKIESEIQECGEKLDSLEKKCADLLPLLDGLKRAHDILFSERDRLNSSRLIGHTDSVHMLQGWIKETDMDRLNSVLAPFSDLTELSYRPPLDEEEPPVVLRNSKVAQPFELITTLYGLPRKGSLDPTPFLAPFFFLYLGLTVSEAGYGLLVSIISLLALKIGKPKGGIRQFLVLLSILGGANVLIGTLVGGWFGFPIRRLMILDPLTDPVSFLLLALALGFVQVWFGVFLNFLTEFKNRNYLTAFFVRGGWLIMLPGLVLYFLLKHPVWGIITLAGAGGVVFFSSPSKNPLARFFGGLYGLYDISGYLSDVLSYSRLLALGLATSVIAMVVNTLCQTALGIPWVGWMIAALIFVVGHLFNLGISFLGGFVHSMRLQFVEFFSKFFQAGGKPFKPLKMESKYIDFY